MTTFTVADLEASAARVYADAAYRRTHPVQGPVMTYRNLTTALRARFGTARVPFPAFRAALAEYCGGPVAGLKQLQALLHGGMIRAHGGAANLSYTVLPE